MLMSCNFCSNDVSRKKNYLYCTHYIGVVTEAQLSSYSLINMTDNNIEGIYDTLNPNNYDTSIKSIYGF
jgi:hypothetical protein